MQDLPLRSLQVQALKNISPFRIVGNLSLEELHDADAREITGGFVPEEFDLLAHVSVSFNGEPPASARVLNAIVMDWVDANRKDLERLFLPAVKTFLSSEYPEIDISELGDQAEGLIWDDQIDYIAGIDPKSGKLCFDVELVLDFEESDPS